MNCWESYRTRSVLRKKVAAKNRETHRRLIEALSYGKRLPDAVYICRPQRGSISDELLAEIARAEIASRPPPDWNLVKLHLKEIAVTFLCYPDFETDPHPALAEATKINLNTGSIVRTDFRQRANPPILHRKETFLPLSDARIPGYAALTMQEEKAGLYRDPSGIGHRVQWLALLQRLNLYYEGHTLVSRPVQRHASESGNGDKPDIARHRTAIKRYDLSKPVKLLLERGLFRKNETFFDYGCGHGMDVEALQNLGYQASGWDPAFRPNVSKIPAAVVNLGYVLNVIEDPEERLAALRNAYALATRLLLVSTMVAGQENAAHTTRYRDGYLTKSKTFQKFYAPGELESVIEEMLNVEVTTLALGICAVFRDRHEAELFEANRNRRRIDWTEVSSQLRFTTATRRNRAKIDRYGLNKALFDAFWQTMLDLGRVPEAGEFDQLREVRAAASGLNKAVMLVTAHNGREVWQMARTARSEDVLVYLAMANFRKRFLRREIPSRIKYDIRSFFGDLSAGLEQGRQLLFAAGDPDEVELAIDGLTCGVFDREQLHFTFHRSVLGNCRQSSESMYTAQRCGTAIQRKPI